ncbi:hypothetical protein SAMD00019534_023440, partial [Acytostelium subglobosum LB1]|uniref:hypothetical protein n=1 Tax=Acytostelium subglobosum LB1 TaxID=1410327 RepID=UPI000644D889
IQRVYRLPAGEDSMSFLTKKKSSTLGTPATPQQQQQQQQHNVAGQPPGSPGFAPRQCPYKKFGCPGYLNTRNEYENHIRDDSQMHLQLVVEKFDHQFDLHTQLMAHFTQQMEDQMDRTMKVVKNHMDTFGTQMQVKLDEGIKRVESQQQQLAKRLVTHQIANRQQLQSSDESSSTDAALRQHMEAQLASLHQTIKKEMAELTDDSASKLERKVEKASARVDKVELDMASKVESKVMMVTIEETLAQRSEGIESTIVKRIEEKEKKRMDHSQVAVDSKIGAVMDRVKTLEHQCGELTADLRKVKLEGGSSSGNLSATPSRSSVSLPITSASPNNNVSQFNKTEVLDEIKKIEQQFNDRLAKSEAAVQNDVKDTKGELTELQRKFKTHHTELVDKQAQLDKQLGSKLKQLEDDIKKDVAHIQVVQATVQRHSEVLDKEREREHERLRMQDMLARLEASQKKLEKDIADGNEQVERLLREEGVSSPSNSRFSPQLSKRSSASLQSPLQQSSPSVAGANSSSSTSSVARPQSMDLTNGESETGVLWEYDPMTEKWIRLAIKLKVEKKYFAEGALRQAYHTMSMGVFSNDIPPLAANHSFPTLDSISTSTQSEAAMQLSAGTKFVLKLYKKEAEQQTRRELYFDECRMQLVCRDWGHRFNQKNPPKKIEFLMSWVVELTDRNGPVLCSIEPLLVGEFKKNNSNYGAVLNNRSTPQAFSHFTYERSEKQMIIIDIQGVDDVYTDPQIHTSDGKGFGLGNLGKTGINKFITTHKCNAVCALLGLDVKLGGSTSSSAKNQLRGTMVMPDIVEELMAASPYKSHSKIGANQLAKLDMSRKELKCINTLQSFREVINSSHMHDTDRYLCVGYGDGVLRVFDNENNWSCLHTINAHRKVISSIHSNDQYIFTSSPDQTIKVHSLKNPSRPVETLNGHSGEVSCIRANQRHLFSCSYDKTIKVWDLATFREIKSLEGHTKYIKCLALAGRYLFSGGNDQMIYVWDTETYTCLFTMQGHEDWVLSLQVYGGHLFSTSKDNVIKIWDLTDFHCVETLKGHWSSVYTCHISNDRLMYSGSEDNSIKVWDLDSLDCVHTQQKASSLGIRSLFVRNNQLISTSYDGSIKIWEWTSK